MRFAMTVAAFSAVCLAVPATAATIIQTDNEFVMHGLNRFDTSLGTLNSVTLKIDINKSNFNQLYGPSAASGDYGVSWTTNGMWNLINAYTGNLSVALSGSGSTTVSVQAGGPFSFGYFSIFNVTGSQTFALNTANFLGTAGSSPIILDGNYRGYSLTDASDTTFSLPADFAVRRLAGVCGGGGSEAEDFCGSTVYTLTYDYTPTAVAGVPEPATWAMMMLGFGAIGIGMRQRRTVALA